MPFAAAGWLAGAGADWPEVPDVAAGVLADAAQPLSRSAPAAITTMMALARFVPNGVDFCMVISVN
jgi:hypothetical protein